MRINTVYFEENPVAEEDGRWFKPAEYPEGVYVCPLCELPETDGIYEQECDCWDDDEK